MKLGTLVFDVKSDRFLLFVAKKSDVFTVLIIHTGNRFTYVCHFGESYAEKNYCEEKADWQVRK